MSQPTHLVGVRFLNSRPLVAGLEAGIPAPFGYRYAAADPAECAARLASGAVAGALVPVVALAEAAGARAVPGLGVACRGAVYSVLLVSKVPLARIGRLAVHTASRTSEILARLLLSETEGIRPAGVRCSPPLEHMLAHADAAVVIGDVAMHLRGRTGLVEVDLGQAWREWTGLPFVFARWAVTPGAPPGIETLLEDSLAYAEQRWSELLPRWATAHGIGLPEVASYLGERLHFRLDEEDERGSRAFLELATARGLLSGPPQGPPGAVVTLQSEE
ncbi:MAG: menaquinone biosynthesis protein [Acidobacteriota bacterium]|jgi:predicted solute-binding protein